MVTSTCWARSAVTVMNWQVMSTLPVVTFGMRASEDWSTNSILVSSPNRPLATILAMSMSKPTRLPLSSLKCQGALVLPVPTIR